MRKSMIENITYTVLGETEGFFTVDYDSTDSTNISLDYTLFSSSKYSCYVHNKPNSETIKTYNNKNNFIPRYRTINFSQDKKLGLFFFVDEEGAVHFSSITITGD